MGSVFLCIVASRRKKYDVASPLKIIRRGWWWWWLGRGGGGGGGGKGGGSGWEEAGLVIAAPTPFPTQLLRFHLTFVTRFVFLLLLYLHMRRGRKGSLFQSPFDIFGKIGTVFFLYILSNDVQKEDSVNNSSSKGVVFTQNIS